MGAADPRHGKPYGDRDERREHEQDDTSAIDRVRPLSWLRELQFRPGTPAADPEPQSNGFSLVR
ncbi:hypothetical protein GCM10027436_42530 [Actinophytocola sediminis]